MPANMNRATFAALLSIPILLVGCASLGRDVGATAGIAPLKPGDPGYETDLQVQFLAVAGFRFSRGIDVVMTTPFYSHQSLLRVLTLPIQSDTNAVENLTPDIHEIPAILVGHAHYDHLMDLPYLAKHRATNAVIYASNTASNILRAVLPPNRLVGLDNLAGDFRQRGAAGKWINISPTLRFMALKSEHSPHFGPIKLFKGQVTEPQGSLPRCACGWKEGQTLAYIIDFLKPDGAIAFRIVFHDSAVSSPPFGFLPKLPPAETRDPDVLVVCLGAARNSRNYPEAVIAELRPRHVIVGHWEDFFGRKPVDPQDTKVVILGQPKKFLSRAAAAMSSGDPIMPLPGAWMRFEPGSD
jgi:hypothetical protein